MNPKFHSFYTYHIWVSFSIIFSLENIFKVFLIFQCFFFRGVALEDCAEVSKTDDLVLSLFLYISLSLMIQITLLSSHPLLGRCVVLGPECLCIGCLLSSLGRCYILIGTPKAEKTVVLWCLLIPPQPLLQLSQFWTSSWTLAKCNTILNHQGTLCSP